VPVAATKVFKLGCGAEVDIPSLFGRDENRRPLKLSLAVLRTFSCFV
jgi:hypothetical protein